MPKRERHHGDQQLNLFDLPAPIQAAGPVPTLSSLTPADLTDAQLLSRFPHASVVDVGALGAEVRRRRPEGWQAATLALWDRFRGFGESRPMPEQLVVLNLAQGTDGQGFLRDLLARGPVNECLEPDLLLAAAACRLALPTPIVTRGLTHSSTEVRRAAAKLAIVSDVPVEMLVPCLSDPARAVRREAAIALAEVGETIAMASLLLEMRIQPSRLGLEALSFVADEDVVIALGQIARQHPDWCQIVIEVLETIDHPKAGRVAAGLMA